MMDQPVTPAVACPYCGAEMEEGCLMGKDSLIGFQWYRGDPTFWKNLIPHGETVGDVSLFAGTYMRGQCCHTCRKIVLEF